MKEQLFGEPSINRKREVCVKKLEDTLEIIIVARENWIENIKILDLKIPHNDIQEDQRTYSYHVLRNAWLANVDKLDRLEKELKELIGSASLAN